MWLPARVEYLDSQVPTSMSKLLRWHKILLGFVVSAITFVPPAAHAQQAVLELDPLQTQVSFALGDVLHTVHGTFKLKRSVISFDPGTGKAGGLVVVDGASGESGSHARDRKMNSDVLQSDEFPDITFAPQQVQGQVLGQGEFNVQVLGIFTMHGASHPLTLIVHAHLTGNQLTADTSFNVPYVSWGLKNPSTLFLRVNDSVDIAIHAVGEIRAVGGR